MTFLKTGFRSSAAWVILSATALAVGIYRRDDNSSWPQYASWDTDRKHNCDV